MSFIMTKMATNFAVSTILLLVVTISTNALKPRLNKYVIEEKGLTVSGISSGGAMSMQFHFAHSKNVSGAGIFAGGPYLCAKPGLLTAASCMTLPSLIDVQKLIENADKLSTNMQIDPVSNLNGEKAYIFHGTVDTVVAPGSAPKIVEMYKHYGVQLKTQLTIAAAHGFPTIDKGAPCWQLSPLNEFLNKCNYSGAYEMLNYLYGGNLIRPTGLEGSSANILEYDQTEFMATPLLSTLAANAHLYVPTACQDGVTKCKLHVLFHGCMASQAFMGYDYIIKTDQMAVAELNNIILLAPQVKITLTNPSACWDWYGYTNDQYATRDGPQIRAVFKMVNRVVNGS